MNDFLSKFIELFISLITIKNFTNMRTITFNELRKIKDALPSGSMHRIADELGLDADTVRNFFGGHL